VDCEDFREALSARLDNEEVADHPTDAHLEHCADCAFWYDAAVLITRRTRTSAVVAWPDVADAVLARVPPGADRSWSRLRTALGGVGVLQCGTGLVTLASGGPDAGTWQLALGAAVLALVALLGRALAPHKRPTPPKPAANHLHHPAPEGDVAHLAIPMTRSAKTA
jgi:predicted anti-sigma-YlaC factor YlaD